MRGADWRPGAVAEPDRAHRAGAVAADPGAGAPPAAAAAADRRGIGPPVAQSSSSTVCTTGSGASPRELGDAADIAGGDHVGAGQRDVGELAVAQRRRPVPAAADCRCRPSRSTDGLPARRPTANPAAASSALGSRSMLLAVLQRAGGVIGDPQSRRLRRRPAASPSAADDLADVAGERGDPRRLVGIGRVVAQQKAVILDHRAAARGVDDDRVEPARRRARAPRRRYWRGPRRAPAPPRRDGATSAPQQPLPGATTTSQPCRVSSRIVASLISGASTCWAQPGSSATRIRRSPSAGKTCGRSIGEAAGTGCGASASSGRSRGGSSAGERLAPGARRASARRNQRRPGQHPPSSRRSSRSSHGRR